MKSYFTILLSCLFLMTGLLTCQSLEENPAGTLVRESFFKTTADLEAAVNAVYKSLADDAWGGFGSNGLWPPLQAGDDLCNPNGGNVFDTFRANDLTTSMFWNRCYLVIREACNVIENCQEISGNENYINSKIAEAHFLRAFTYFWLVRLYGAIPIVEMKINYEITLSPVSEVYALIVDDLKFAINHLPQARGNYDGHPSVSSARALLGQVYLTMAGWPLKKTEYYALAAAEAKAVIESGEYALMDDFLDLLIEETRDNCIEIVWSIQYCNFPDCGTWQRSTMIGLNCMPPEEGGWGGQMAEVGFYNRFPDNYRKEQTFHTVFEKREYVGGPIIEYVPFETSINKHPYYKKFRHGYVQGERKEDGYPADYNLDSDHMGGFDLNYLRYAEVLLMYAEAQCMSEGGPNQMAYDCINAVRKRANKGEPDDLTPGLSQIDFRNEVIDERGWEFAMEYCRWFDLVRTEKVEEMMALKDQEVDFLPVNPPTKDRWLMPVPESERRLNPLLANKVDPSL